MIKRNQKPLNQTPLKRKPLNRTTLAATFSNGDMPTQEAFADLIYSTVNMVDDGFEKDAEGMKLAQLNNSSKLISFYDGIIAKEPLWSISFSLPGHGSDPNAKNLGFFYGDNTATGLTLASAPCVEQGIRLGINTTDPRHDLDVRGIIVSDGRIGREEEQELKVRADGQWHPIRTGLRGCQAFEIMAGVGREGTGKYALLHAFALSTFNSKNSSINYHQAHFSSKCDRIELRWTGNTKQYALEMRTQCDFHEKSGENIYVRYYITKLWFDEEMKQCVKTSGEETTEQ